MLLFVCTDNNESKLETTMVSVLGKDVSVFTKKLF